MKENLQAANSVDQTEGIATPKLLKINLQLFAEGDPEPTPTPEPEPTPEPTSTPEPTPSPEPDVSQTQAFAHRLKEETTKARDTVIAEMGYQWNGKPITTYAEYQTAIKEQQAAEEAQKLNIDPNFYNEFVGLKDKVSQFETEKQQLQQEKIFTQQETALKSDPVTKDFYTQWESEIKEKAKSYGCDLDTAFTLKIRESLADITKGVATKAEQSAIQKLANNAASSPGSLGDGGDGSKTFFTKEEVKAMSQSEVSKNYDKICESMKKW
jgi:hypothetical protein